ncbi:MAG: hypothetical protein GOMPHAMPRED_004372 [Gomphillus americanus]|uniref:Secreted protein n=1 Tax=Gomphillus americanus TaxID=1940652 RepID=A0A8H3IND4_9LECA|nr:MAG: hypothetical protein GOMPHAMPRED_004372 [Gomphillus americanus]
MKIPVLTLLYSALAAAACSPLIVDDHSTVGTTNTNNVGGYTSDDATCGSLSATSKVLQITPGTARCYWYTNFPPKKPEDAVGGHRAALAFTLTPPQPNWAFSVNIKSWNGTALIDSYSTVTGTTGGTQTVTMPLSSFNGPSVPNLRNIQSFVFGSFNVNAGNWQIGPLTLTCATT